MLYNSKFGVSLLGHLMHICPDEPWFISVVPRSMYIVVNRRYQGVRRFRNFVL